MYHKSAWILWKFQKKVFVNRSSVQLYILSCVRVSIHMYEAKRAVAGCSCSGKEHLNNLRITNNLKNTKFAELVNSNELVFHVT